CMRKKAQANRSDGFPIVSGSYACAKRRRRTEAMDFQSLVALMHAQKAQANRSDGFPIVSDSYACAKSAGEP
ncbi:hypothetical protein ABXT13_11950, partial [Staphylococcus caprae]|uniref:hypothetical protein n=1 Tax=Staphylococcus caprae TaxID=29380 RepID=UPI0033973674